MQKIIQHTLDNGMKVLVLPDQSRGAVHIEFRGILGRRMEPDDQLGVSHLLEHTVFEGTQNFSDKRALRLPLERAGGIFNGETDFEDVSYWVKIIPEYQDVGFRFIAEVVQHALLRPEDVDRNREVIKRELAISKDAIDRILSLRSQAFSYPSQPAGHIFFEEELTLDTLTAKHLEDWYSLYHAGNFALSVGGAITEGDALALADKYFSKVPSGEAIGIPPSQFEPSDGALVISRPSEQAALQINIPIASIVSGEHFADAVAGITLGRLLGERLRQRDHLTYHASVSPKNLSDTSYVKIRTNFREEDLERGYGAIREELESLEGTITSEDLEIAQNQLKSDIVFRNESIPRLMRQYSLDLLFRGRMRHDEEKIEAIEAVTLQDARAAGERMDQASRRVVLVAPSVREITFPLR